MHLFNFSFLTNTELATGFSMQDFLYRLNEFVQCEDVMYKQNRAWRSGNTFTYFDILLSCREILIKELEEKIDFAPVSLPNQSRLFKLSENLFKRKVKKKK